MSGRETLQSKERTRSSLGMENVMFSSRPASSSAPVAPHACNCWINSYICPTFVSHACPNFLSISPHLPTVYLGFRAT